MKIQNHSLSVLTFASTFLAAALILGGALPIDSSFAGPGRGRYKGKAVRTTSKGKPKSRALPGVVNVSNTTDPNASFGNRVVGSAKKEREVVNLKLEIGDDGTVRVNINGRTSVGTLRRSKTSSRPRSPRDTSLSARWGPVRELPPRTPSPSRGR